MSFTDESDPEAEIESLDISNDQYYQPLSGFTPKLATVVEEYDIPRYGSSTIRHSLPAYDLWRPFFPTYLSEERFRNFHRPKLRHFNNGPQRIRTKPFPIKNISKTIYRYQKRLRNNVIEAINSGMAKDDIIKKFLLIHKAKDLSAKRGELFLFEYSEQYPPILPQVGMASNIKTYIQPSVFPNYLRTIHKNQQTPQEKDKSPDTANNNLTNLDAYANQISSQIHPSAMNTTQTPNEQLTKKGCCKIGSDYILNKKAKPIYFNSLKAGHKQQVMENNMFRAPVYQHELSSCDFLVIRTRNNFYIRTVKVIFTVGQTMPLVVVPQPTEAAINKFRLELSNLFLHKLFMESDDQPPTINFDLFAKLFPDYSTEILRRRLAHNGAERVRGVPQTLYSRGSSKYGKSSLKELRSSFTPERYCYNMSMLAARQRLRELNYTESMINPPNDAETEVEVLAAPWNTSKAVVNTILGRSYLDLSKHLIDPTGIQREGFSCVAWTKSPTEDQQIKERMNGTKCATPSKSLSSIPTKNPLGYKITREKIERLEIFKREALHIAEIQSNVLNSKEILSSDEDIEDEIDDENQLDSSFDQQLRDLDKLVVGGRTERELDFEKEEAVRLEMLKEFKQNGCQSISGPLKQSPRERVGTIPVNVAAFKNKFLKIVRTYNSDEGPIQRTEIVRDPKIITLYIKKKEDSISASQTCNDQKHTEDVNYMNDTRLSDTDVKVHDRRHSRSSLGHGELCRADGTRLTISKKVLNVRAMRKHKRDSLRVG